MHLLPVFLFLCYQRSLDEQLKQRSQHLARNGPVQRTESLLPATKYQLGLCYSKQYICTFERIYFDYLHCLPDMLKRGHKVAIILYAVMQCSVQLDHEQLARSGRKCTAINGDKFDVPFIMFRRKLLLTMPRSIPLPSISAPVVLLLCSGARFEV